MARDAGVHRLLLFHHDPDRSDAAVRALELEAQSEFAGAIAARESVLL